MDTGTRSIFMGLVLGAIVLAVLNGADAQICSSFLAQLTAAPIDLAAGALLGDVTSRNLDFNEISDLLSGVCNSNSWMSAPFTALVSLISTCPSILSHLSLASQYPGIVALTGIFARGSGHVCACSPYLLSGMVLYELKGYSLIRNHDGPFSTMRNVSLYCREIYHPQLKTISVPAVVEKVAQGVDVCPELLTISDLTREAVAYIRTFVKNCKDFDQADLQCALRSSTSPEFSECISSAERNPERCSKYNCVTKHIGGTCGIKAATFYVDAVNGATGSIKIGDEGCTSAPATDTAVKEHVSTSKSTFASVNGADSVTKSAYVTDREVNEGNTTAPSTCATDDVVSNVNGAVSLIKTQLQFERTIDGLNDLFNNICQDALFKGYFEGFVNLFNTCPALVGRTDISTLSYGPIKFEVGFTKLLTKGFTHFCKCVPYMASVFVLNAMKDRSQIHGVDGQFPTVANLSFLCDEIQDDMLKEMYVPKLIQTAIKCQTTCPDLFRLAGLETNTSVQYARKFVNGCAHFKNESFACAIKNAGNPDVKECFEAGNDHCSLFDCVVSNLTDACEQTAAMYYVTSVNIQTGKVIFDTDTCYAPSSSSSLYPNLPLRGSALFTVMCVSMFLFLSS